MCDQLVFCILLLFGFATCSVVPVQDDEVTIQEGEGEATVHPSVKDLSDKCPLKEENGQRLWKYSNQPAEVVLTAANVLCLAGDSCSAPNNSQTEYVHPLPFIQLDLQLGDWIEVFIDTVGVAGVGPGGRGNYEDRNGSGLHLSVSRLQLGDVYSCTSYRTVSEVMARELGDKNFTIGFDLLKPGFHLFKVSITSSDSLCEFVWKLNVTVRQQECIKARGTTVCSDKGICTTNANKSSFTCQCCPGYIGKYCEEIDGCYGNPCKHGGFCVDIAEGLSGTTYQCLCPHGYRGRSCEEEVNLCDRRPCQNNGTCHGNQTDYWCECTLGFTGLDCETNINECLSNPCVHGVCEDGLGNYKCYCLPGYGGDHCEFEYDECDSSPCINGGACEDLVAGYRCHCGPGYKGKRCQVKIDLCQPNPCLPPAQCVDRGNNYSCVCHPGYNGPGCTQHYDPCYPNPCQNGGSCWPSLDSFFCSCRPGYTGDICEEPLYPPKPLPRTLNNPQSPDEESTEGPTSASLDHLHNIYIAAASLAGACFIVITIVSICHCRIHKTYQRFTHKLSRSCSEIKQQKLPRKVFTESPWERF